MGQPYLNNLVSAVRAPAMSLSSRDGQIRAGGAQGLYVQDIRAISQAVLTVDGSEPAHLATDVLGGAVNEFHSVVAATGAPGPDPVVLVTRRRTVNAAGMVERFTVTSYAPARVTCRVELAMACDLADIMVVKAGVRPPALPARSTADGLAWELPGRCSVRATASPAYKAVFSSLGAMAWEVAVEPGGSAELTVRVDLDEHFSASLVAAAPAALTGEFDAPKIDAADQRLRRLVELSLADLEALRMGPADEPSEAFVAAGAPWYLTLFGRDSIWAARMMLPLGTDLAMGTLKALARHQGRRFDPVTGEEPGKILHEVRRPVISDDISGANLDDGLPPVYYGSVDATLLWVCLLHDAWKWGAPDEDVGALLPAMQACLAWLAGTGARDDGWASYIDKSGRGLSNQGWKDSYDAVQFRDGQLATPPIALCEVQGYAHEAAVSAAELLDAFGLAGSAHWLQLAAHLAGRFREKFWVEDKDGAYPAMALQGDGAPVDSLSSNIGHLLGTGILNPEETSLVTRRLISPDLNSGFGLRTLATSSRGFNPVSYHCGSVWAHDTAIAIAGLARAGGPGASDAIASLVEGLLSAAESFDYRLPELYGGNTGGERRGPLPYPASCHPQAWTAASSVVVLAALVGIRPDLPNGRLVLDPPRTPVGLSSVEGLRAGGKLIAVHIGSSGAAVVTGLPPGVQVIS